ncbi:unnamed protein product, partial [Musa hybrid cultivar]
SYLPLDHGSARPAGCLTSQGTHGVSGKAGYAFFHKERTLPDEISTQECSIAPRVTSFSS